MNKAPRQRRRPAKNNREATQNSGTPISKLAREHGLTSKELRAILEKPGHSA